MDISCAIWMRWPLRLWEQAGKPRALGTLAAGKQDGDVATQVQAIESAIGRGDKGILITPNGPGVQNAIDKAANPSKALLYRWTVK